MEGVLGGCMHASLYAWCLKAVGILRQCSEGVCILFSSEPLCILRQCCVYMFTWCTSLASTEWNVKCVKYESGTEMMMIAFITIKSSLVPLIEGLCAQIYFRFESLECGIGGQRRGHQDDGHVWRHARPVHARHHRKLRRRFDRLHRVGQRGADVNK